MMSADHQQKLSKLKLKFEYSFRNPAVPSNALNEENVLAYFCDHQNRFYDRGCVNEQLRMQNHAHKPEVFERMPGIQYVLVIASPPLFVIRKHNRNSPTDITPLCYYYVLDGTVYQAPDIYSLVQSRLVNAIDPMRNAMLETLSHLRFDVAQGYHWSFKNRPAESARRKQRRRNNVNGGGDETADDGEELSMSCGDDRVLSDPQNERATAYQRLRTDALLKLMVNRYATNMNFQRAPPAGGESADSARGNVFYNNNGATIAADSAVDDASSSFSAMAFSTALENQQQAAAAAAAAAAGSLMSESGNNLANAPTPPATLDGCGGDGRTSSATDERMDVDAADGLAEASRPPNNVAQLGVAAAPIAVVPSTAVAGGKRPPGGKGKRSKK